MEGGHFDKTDFKNAILRGIRLLGTDLSGALNLTREQLSQTCAEKGTRLPAGILLRPCTRSFVIIRRWP
jgi:uncharacterized protein YjbI with pentapeptide repeats